MSNPRFKPPVGTQIRMLDGHRATLVDYVPGLGGLSIVIELGGGRKWPSTLDQVYGYGDTPMYCSVEHCEGVAVSIAHQEAVTATRAPGLMTPVPRQVAAFCVWHVPIGAGSTGRLAMEDDFMLVDPRTGQER